MSLFRQIKSLSGDTRRTVQYGTLDTLLLQQKATRVHLILPAGTVRALDAPLLEQLSPKRAASLHTNS
jgi:hypothetical protein